jgi:methionine-S-sulfoxide reductase
MDPTTNRRLFVVLTAAALGAATLVAAQPAAKGRPPAPGPRVQTAVFAGGCFWCTESDMEHIPGVIAAESGYTGGAARNPSYEQVGAGASGHVEAVRVTFDPRRISYRQLVDRFWRTIDVTDDGGQFCDRGPNYRTAVFVTPAQRPIAEASRAAAARSLRSGRMLTPIRPLTAFYPAEAYHQDFYKKNPLRYRVYRQGCGRDSRLRAIWGR